MAQYYVTGGTLPILVEDGQQICDGQSIQFVVEDMNNGPNGATQYVAYSAEPQHPESGLFHQQTILGSQIAGAPLDQRQNVYIINTPNDLPVQQTALKADVIHTSLANEGLVNIVYDRGNYVIAGSKLPVNNIHEVQQQPQQQLLCINIPENNINYEASINPGTPVTKMQPTVRTPQQRTAQSLTLQAQGQCSTGSQQCTEPGTSDKKHLKIYRNKTRGGIAGGGPPRKSLIGDVPPVKKSPTPRSKNSPKPQQQLSNNVSSPMPQQPGTVNLNNRTPSSNHLGAVYRAKTFGTAMPTTVGTPTVTQRPSLGRGTVKNPENAAGAQSRKSSIGASPVPKSLPALHYPAMDSLSERIKQARLQNVLLVGTNPTSGNAGAIPPGGATPRPPLHPAQQKAQNTGHRALVQNQRPIPAAVPIGNQSAKQQQQQQQLQQRQAVQQTAQAQQTIEFTKQKTSACQQKYQRETPSSDNEERMEVDSGASESGMDIDMNHYAQEVQPEVREGDSASVAYLQKVIDNPHTTVVQDQIEGHTVKMLVVLQSGVQRLITFDIPNEPCTVQDLLEQANISSTGGTSVSLVSDRSLGINYIVEGGTHMGALGCHEDIETGEHQFQENQNTPPDSSSPNYGASDENSNSSVAPNEEPKYIEGMAAVCPNCGIGSVDFNRCSRCKKRLPENVKTTPTNPSTQVKETMISIDTFYKKVHEQNALAKIDATMGKKRSGRGGKRLAAKARPVKEPECLTISSDEEEDGSVKTRRSGSTQSNATSTASGHPNNLQHDEPDTIHEKEPVITNSTSTMSTECRDDTEGRIEGAEDERDVEDRSVQEPLTSLVCRTVRIGSYKFVPQKRIDISPSGVTIAVPLLEDDKAHVNLNVKLKDIVKVLIHFMRSMPVLFFYTTPATGATIRELLGMQDPKGPYYDPAGKDHTHKRITLLPEVLTDEAKLALKSLFQPNNLLEELTLKEANDILVRASPRDNLHPQSLAHMTRRQSQPAAALNASVNGGGIQVMTVYPPPPAKGGIAINTEDYICLGEDQFLNDAIIDFYLRYLTMEKLSQNDQNRTHVLSSYFYKRLTSPHAQAGESAATLTPAARRHARVQKWTKNVNIFEKDFVIIPINEHAHWFLAIICYPGLVGKIIPTAKPPKENSIQKTAAKSKKTKEMKMQAVTIGSTTITPLATTITIDQMDEGSERDEAEGDDEEMDMDSDDDEETESQEEPSPPFSPMRSEVSDSSMVKQPCILIFDSLAGASRSRVVATLRDYLSCEHLAKVGSEKAFTKDTIKGSSPKVPQQSNFTDCGLYLLQYVESFFKAPILNYTLPIKTLKNWFEEIVVTRKREELARLLVRLMNQTKGVKTIALPVVQFPTMDGKLRPKPEPPAEPKTPKVETDAKKKQVQQTPQALSNADDKTRLVAVSTSSVTTTDESSDSAGRITRTTTVYQIIGCSPGTDIPATESSSDSIFDTKRTPSASSGTLSYLRKKRIPRLVSRDHEAQENQSASAKKHKGDNDSMTKISSGNSSSGLGSGLTSVVKSGTAYDSCK